MKGCPRLLRLFGRDLRTWLYADPGGWNVLPVAYSTWLAGGCWVLARGLHEWIGGQSSLWAIYSTPIVGALPRLEMPQHVVLKIGDCFLDGDGASTEKELLRRWEREEGLSKPRLKPFVMEEVEQHGIECPIGAVRDLVRELGRTFGPGENALRWITSHE